MTTVWARITYPFRRQRRPLAALIQQPSQTLTRAVQRHFHPAYRLPEAGRNLCQLPLLVVVQPDRGKGRAR